MRFSNLKRGGVDMATSKQLEKSHKKRCQSFASLRPLRCLRRSGHDGSHYARFGEGKDRVLYLWKKGRKIKHGSKL